MAWWQVWRRSDDSATVAGTGASENGAGSVDDGPLATTAPAGHPTPVIHRVPDVEPTAAVSQPREPQGWRLLPPPVLLAHKAMPVTANMAVQRSLAAHIPVPQLAATARPLGHERRADGPIGMASVLRTVSASASASALLPATHIAGPDLVLRRKTAVGEGPLTEEYSTPPSHPRPSANSPVDRSSATSLSSASRLSASAAGSEPAPESMVLRALGPTSPLLSDFTPVTSLTSASSFASPSPAASSASSLIARSPDDSGATEEASPRNMPVTARQRRVIEVRSAREPVSLSSFGAAPSPAPPSVVARIADGTPLPLPDSAQAAPRSSSGDDREDDFESSAGPSLSTLAEIRPTVGRRVGLGVPMNALPSSAISRLPEPDPFAGWNEAVMPLAPGSSTLPGSVGGGAGGMASGSEGGLESGFQSSSGAPESASVRRIAEAALPGSDTSSSPESVIRGTVSTVRRTAEAASTGSSSPSSPESSVRESAFIDADESTSNDSGSHTVPSLVLSGLVEHAPLIGHRRLDRSLDESLAPVSVAGTERGVTSVPVRWGNGSGDATARHRSDGGTGPGPPIHRSVDAPRDSSGPSGSGPSGRARSGSPEPMVSPSPSVNRSTPTGPVGSSGVSTALSPPRSTEHALRSPAPLGSGGTVQQPLLGVGSPTNSGTFPTAPASLGSSDGSAGATESSDFRSIDRSEDEPVALLRPWHDTSSLLSPLGAGSATGTASGQEAGPFLRTPDPSAVRAPALPVVNVNRAVAQNSSTAALMLQRESQPGAAQPSNHASPSSGHANGDAEMAPAPASHGEGGSSTASGSDAGGESAAGGAAGASGPTSAQADAELDRLAGKLYERIRQRVRRELLDDRERAGFALDGVR